MMIEKHVPISSAKTRLLELLRQVEESREKLCSPKWAAKGGIAQLRGFRWVVRNH